MSDDTQKDIEEKVRGVLAETLRGLGRGPMDIAADRNLLEGGILDSFGFLDFVGGLEDSFDTEIDITDLDEESMVTVAGMTAEIARILGR